MARTVIGLDIGRTAVRAVELQSGRGSTLRRHGSVALPPGAVEAGVVTDPHAVTSALRRLWKEHRFSGRQVRLGVCSGSVLVRQIELDWMPPADLKRALRYQVADLLPVAVDDANLDHVHLGEHERTDPQTGLPRRMVRILLVATARGAVDETVRAVQAAGLRPVTADLAPLALVRAAAAAGSGVRDEAARAQAEAVIDVGSDKVAVAVHTAGVPHFVRVVPGIGGDMLTRALAESSGLAWDDAERTKRSGAADADPHVRAAVERLVEEVRATVEFHSATDPTHLVARALVTGSGGNHPGFLDACRRGLGVPVEPLELARVVSLPARRTRSAKTDPDAAGGAGTAPTSELLLPASLCLGATA